MSSNLLDKQRTERTLQLYKNIVLSTVGGKNRVVTEIGTEKVQIGSDRNIEITIAFEGLIDINLKADKLDLEILKTLGNEYIENVFKQNGLTLQRAWAENGNLQINLNTNMMAHIELSVQKIQRKIDEIKDKVLKEITDETIKARIIADELNKDKQ